MSKRKLRAAELADSMARNEISDVPEVQKPSKKSKSKKSKDGETDALDDFQQSLDQEKSAQLKALDEKKFKNKQRVLVLGSSTITPRFRHLMQDMISVLPHSKKEVKFEASEPVSNLNEVCEMHSCNNCIYFEVRKYDTYMWISRSPHGPSVRFYVTNTHTLAELNLMGNCLKGSRPMLVFDKQFDSAPQWKIIKELFTQVFGTPRGHPKSKPFVDHVLSFFIQDGRIWFRNYQLGAPQSEKSEDPELIEIGPRFVLQPIRMFAGSFGGPTLFFNEHFVSPNAIRADAKKTANMKYATRLVGKEEARVKRKNAMAYPSDHLDKVFD